MSEKEILDPNFYLDMHISLLGINKQFPSLLFLVTLLKCAHILPDVFSTEDLPIHRKMLLAWKNQCYLLKGQNTLHD